MRQSLPSQLLKISCLVAVAALAGACGSSDADDDDGETVIITEPDTNGQPGGPDVGTTDGGTTDTGGFRDTGKQNDGGLADTGPTPDTGPPTSGLPALGDGSDKVTSVRLETLAGGGHGLAKPYDLAFNPEAPNQLWSVNREHDAVVILFNPGGEDQRTEKFNARGASHFLSKPAALAFGQPGFMATAQQEDMKTQPTTPADFMGPTLWTTDLSTFDGGHHGHMDMLHNSPLASGIAWEEENTYWVMDGHHGAVTQYQFNMDHGPGGANHRDGVVRRYVDGKVGIEEGVAAHIDLDRDSGQLYIADTKNQRIAVLDTTTGSVGPRIRPNYDGTDQAKVVGAEISTLIDGAKIGLKKPAGLELHDGHLYVTDNATSTVYAFKPDGTLVDSMDLSEFISEGDLMGLALDEDNHIFLADAGTNRIIEMMPAGQNSKE